ncbi:putative sulfate transporter 3.3 [Asimina triloba]
MDGRAFSRSAVNHNAGAKTAMSNIVMAISVMITLLFLMPLFHYTPNVVLGAIIVTAVVGLIDIPAVYLIWKVDKIDFIICVAAFLGVIFISVQDGLGIAIGISVLKLLLQITRPKTVILGNIPGTEVYRNLGHYKDARRIPGFLILSIEAPVNFANTTYLTERISRWVEEEEFQEREKQMDLHYVVLDMTGVHSIDTSGVTLLTDLKKMTEKQGLKLVLVNPVGDVLEKLQKADQAKHFVGKESLFLTVGEAVATLSSQLKGDASNNV